MKQLTSSEIREMFLKFFESKNHKRLESASLIPHNDPTLLWINAGVAPLKSYFDGSESPENPRMTNAQKSLRTNDIENVGKTARHHTFFEMLGNFSIGDYFRTDAIAWWWEMLTSEEYFAFDKEKLYITVYPTDRDSYNSWLELGVDESHIIKTEYNFWEIGEGPCGPCTEVFFDRGEEWDKENIGIRLIEEDLENDRYIEIGNIVLSQFNSKSGLGRDEYPELPNKNIDTGMGLERMTCIIQNTETNYETDLFTPIMDAISKLTDVKYEDHKMAYRVIADHIRTVTFAVSDGALLSNEGRGYVLRRILRRAVRYGRKLGINKPFMFNLVDVVGDIMNEFYPYLNEKAEFVKKVIKSEEERFLATLADGEKKLEDIIKDLDGKEISGKDAFMLYDTFGFPFELTLEFAEENGLTVNKVGFDSEMEAQRERARAARGDMESMNAQNEALLNFRDDSHFVGYDEVQIETKIIGLMQDDQFVDELVGEGVVFLAMTPFYAESGGQVADLGQLLVDGVEVACVTDVQKAPNKQHMHKVTTSSVLKKGDVVGASIDSKIRTDIMRNHSATHLLHKAIKEVLGEHANQAGAYKDAKRLRLDITHTQALTHDELKAIERRVNEMIWASVESDIREMPIDEARALGAMALFGEKYGDVVRVVNFNGLSIELCGGTHVKNTNEIGIFKILSEGGIGAGVRRIEATTGQNAYEFISSLEDNFDTGIKLLKTTRPNFIGRVEGLLKEQKELNREVESLHAKISNMEAGSLGDSIEEINGVSVLMSQLKDIDMNNLRQMIDDLKEKHEKLVVVLSSVVDGKVLFAAGVTKDLSPKDYHAGNLVKLAASICGGGGGGRPDFAQAGAKDASKINDAFTAIKEELSSK
jgi:alanyl-tRNA synthetase